MERDGERKKRVGQLNRSSAPFSFPPHCLLPANTDRHPAAEPAARGERKKRESKGGGREKSDRDDS